MVLVGLSLVFVSISFLCYRHLPLSWPLSWLPFLSSTSAGQRRASQSKSKPDAEKVPRPATSDPRAIQLPDKRVSEVVPDATVKLPPLSTATRITAPPSPASRIHLASSHLKVASPTASTRSPSISPFPTSPSTTTPRGPPRLSQLSTPSLLMPPPPRLIPSRLPPPTSSRPSSLAPSKVSTSSLSPLPTGYTPLLSKSGKKSRKVLLAPGHSPLDWAALQATLHPPSTLIRVTPSELKKRNGRKGNDAWTVLGGKVYDLGPYTGFHPGGDGELLRCAGKQGEALFEEVHPWVNWEGMMRGCVVGIAVSEGDGDQQGSLEEMD